MNIIKVKDKMEIVYLKLSLNNAVWALLSMYEQYCGDKYGHSFMGAGEEAIGVLDSYGIPNDGVVVTDYKKAHKIMADRDSKLFFKLEELKKLIEDEEIE